VGIFIILFLLGMLRGNHIGHVEDIWLIGMALVVAFWIIRDVALRRRGILR
jgi:hypothetical protein